LPFYKVDWQPTRVALVRWLSREIRKPGISSAQLDAWLSRLLSALESTVPLETLWGTRFAVARRLAEVLEETQQSVHSRGYQQMLLDSYVPESEETVFQFLPERYYPFALYRGMSFQRHYYRLVGDMNEPEVDCAIALDSMNGVETWVRNIERDQRHSFKLPKRGQFFYPDFVARLTDGRTLVVEYKGQMRDYEDAEEKKQLGKLWECRTAGRGVFAWIESPAVTGKSVERQIADAIAT
jgi:type III restriction enzyme